MEIKDNSQWKHKQEGYTVTIEGSGPVHTTFRRDVSVLKGGATPLRRLQTKSFLRQFEKA